MHLPSYKEAKTTDKREYEEKNFKLKEDILDSQYFKIKQ